MELNEMRRIAEAATPGPWITRLLMATQKTAVHSVDDLGKYSTPVVTRGISAENAKHIATFDPPTVLALLFRLEQAEKNADTYQTLYEQRAESLEQAEQAVQRVREVAAEYRPSIPEEVLHEVMKDILRALDGDPRADV